MALDPLELLGDLVRCASVTPETDGVLDVLEAALSALGFACRRLEFSGDGSYPVENLFATRTGREGGPHILFAGHTDVVPPGDEARWSHPPFGAEIDGGALFGRGAVDMKSGLAAFVGALSRLAASGALDKGTVSLAITNDEEADAINGTDRLMAWAAGEGHRFDLAIVGEPSSRAEVGDRIRVGRRGSLSGRITVTGRQGHVAYPEEAANPMPVAAAIVTALGVPLDAGSPGFPPSNLEVTAIETGNRALNVIPGATQISFNVRFNDKWTGESLGDEIERRLAGVPAGACTIRLDLVGRVSHCFVCPRENAARFVAAIAQETGRPPELSTGGGTSDARFVAAYCPVIELGLVGRTMHQSDEHVPLGDVEALTSLYAGVMTTLLGEEGARS